MPISIGTATDTIETDVDLALPAGVLAIGPKTVHVTITLKAGTGTKTFAAGLVPLGQQAGLEYHYSALNAIVIVAGPLADLARLDPSGFTVPINVAGLGIGTHDVQLVPNLQAGLRLLSIDPPVVTVTITGPPASAAPTASAGG